MKSPRSLPVHLFLFLYILISGTYQIVAAVSLVVGFFDLRHQVHQPFEVGYDPSVAIDLRSASLRMTTMVGG